MKNKSNISLSLRKLLLSALVAAPLATLPAPLWALPQVTGITGNPTATNMTASSTAVTVVPLTAEFLNITAPDRAVLRWIEFGSGLSPINANETVHYNLPSTTSAVLNTVSGPATLINGTISSNGQVLILNPNGITLSSTASVSTAGLGLSTINESEIIFLANGNLNYSGTATAPVAVNSATINVGTTGNVFLAGQSVDVSGNINAGTLNVITTTGDARLGVTGALNLGAVGTSTTPGTGNLNVTTGGGNVVVSAFAPVVVHGGTATITTNGGSITQGLGGAITGALVTAPGSGYTAVPTVTFDAPAGVTPATGEARLGLNDISIAAPVAGYTSTPAVAITGGGGTTAAGVPELTITTVGVPGTSAGTLYTAGEVVATVTAPAGGTDLTVTVATVDAGGAITGLAVAGGTGFTSIPTITTFAAPADPAGTPASGATTITATLTDVNVTSAGSGYTSVPTALITATGMADVAGTVDLGVVGVNITTVGVGYTSAPTYTFGVVAGATIATPGAVTFAGAAGTGEFAFRIGDTQSVGTLNINTRTGTTNGTVNLPNIDGNAANRALRVATTSGATTLRNRIGDLQLLESSVAGNLSVTTNLGNITSGGTVTVTGGTIALSAPAGSRNVAFTGAGDLTISTLQAGNNATVVSTTGSVSLPATNIGGNLTVTAANNITQTGALIVDTAAASTARFEATTGSITLENAANDFSRLVVRGGPGGISVRDTDGVTVAGGTLASGAVTLNAGGTVTLGHDAGGVTFNSTLGIETTAGGIDDNTNALVVEGALNLTAPGSIILDGATSTGVGLAHRLGQVNANSTGGNDITIYESTTLNLGNITSSDGGTPPVQGTLRAYSSAGDIINTGVINVGATHVGAGTATAPGNITLDATGSALGAVRILDDFALLGNVAPNAPVLPGVVSPVVGNYLANNFTLVNAGNLTFEGARSTAGAGIAGNLSLTTTATASSITISGPAVVAGTATFSAPGAITASHAANAFSAATVTSGGVVNVNSAQMVTYNGTLTGSGNATFSATDAALRIGTFSSSRGGADTVTFTTTGANNAFNIADTVNGISIFGNVHFNSIAGITVNRAGHSFGRVQVTAGRNQAATIVESGTLRLGTVLMNNTGNFTATSTTGDIIQDPAANGIRWGNTTTAPTATLNAPNGTITLDDATGTTNRIPRIVATANGDITINNTGIETSLGNVTTMGKLTVTVGGNPIAQLSGTRLNVFDTVSLTNTGANDITIGNSGNRLGGVVLNSGSGNITITENPTLNLKSVITSGTFTATSEAGSIIDTADTSVASNFLAAPGVGVPLGAATFTAASDITLDLANSNFSSVGFTTPGNVNVIDFAGDTLLATSTVGGTFTLTNLQTGAVVGQSGVLTIQGDTTLNVNAGGILLNNGANQFGGIRFQVGAGGALITEATTLNLRAGSISQGAANLSTGADFITSGAGSSTFLGDLTITAQGTIVPAANSLVVLGTFTVFAPALKDLSGLSKSSNLAGKDPVNLGAGTYVPPAP